jgi:alkylated DNA nucleotide flippase Atl1
MRTDQVKVGKLLGGQTQFVMPFYQRKYVWDLPKVERLWQDILTVAEEPEGRHFLGPVVIARSPVQGGLDDRWTVIDGQQRITTLSILFCAIRDHAAETDPPFAERIDDLYLVNKYADGDRWFKLLPSMADRATWRKLVLRQIGADGDDRFGDAYRFFRAALRDDEPFDIGDLERTVATQLDIVTITTEPEDNVQRIFDSLNSTGEPLGPADLLRNHVLMRLGDRMDRVYQQHWEPMEQLIPDRHLDELAQLSLVLAGEADVARRDIYQTLQAQMRALRDEAAVEEWVVRLHAMARIFQHIVDPSTIRDPIVRDAVTRLDQWGGTAYHAIALHVLAAHERGALKPQQTADALRVVESYLVRRYLAEVEDKDNARNLRALVRELGDKTPTAAALASLLSREVREFPTDEQIRTALREKVYRKRYTGPLNFVLRCLERSYASREPVDFAVAKVSIEHVLPQRPGQAWLDELAKDVTGDETAEDIHASLVHTLGNLTLTAENEELGNLPFADKRVRLSDSGFAMNREIARHARWGRPEIEARTAQLTDRVIKIWPGPTTPPPPAQSGPAGGAVAAGTGRQGSRRRSPRERRLRRVLAAIPAGRWTSFSVIGEVVGIHPAKVPTVIFEGSYPNTHRVLKKNGAPSEVFHWPDPARTESQRDVLVAEGVRFDQYGRAAQEQFLGADALSD